MIAVQLTLLLAFMEMALLQQVLDRPALSGALQETKQIAIQLLFLTYLITQTRQLTRISLVAITAQVNQYRLAWLYGQALRQSTEWTAYCLLQTILQQVAL